MRSVVRIVCASLVCASLLCTSSQASATSAAPTRIVSLAPSLTEIVYAIGCGPKLVADTSYDDYPAPARSLPHVADLIQVDLERLAVLHPSVVLALHDQEREGAPVESRLGVRVEYLPNRSLRDLFQDIRTVGDACRESKRAASLERSLRARLARITARAQAFSTHPRVLVLLDLPGFTAGKNSFLDDLVRLAGGSNVAAGIDQPYPNVSGEWLLKMQPEVIIVSKATPFGRDIQAAQPWRSLRAVQNNRVYRPPSDDIIQRNGPRIAAGLQWLVGVIHGR